MTFSPSLRNRVKRLEQSIAGRADLSRAEAMRQLRVCRLAMTPEERAGWERDRLAATMAALEEPDFRAGSPAAVAQSMRRRRAARLLRDEHDDR